VLGIVSVTVRASALPYGVIGQSSDSLNPTIAASSSGVPRLHIGHDEFGTTCANQTLIWHPSGSRIARSRPYPRLRGNPCHRPSGALRPS